MPRFCTRVVPRRFLRATRESWSCISDGSDQASCAGKLAARAPHAAVAVHSCPRHIPAGSLAIDGLACVFARHRAHACCHCPMPPPRTFLCALRNCAVQASFAGRLRWWYIDFAFRFRNRYVCETQQAT